MTDVFELLKHDHEEVKSMLSELEQGPTAGSGADRDQLLLRRKMVERLIIEESKHEAVEEEYFWPAVRQHVTEGDSLADEATGQEQEAKKVLDRLDRMNADDPEFEHLLTSHIRDAREHITFEETRVWPELRDVISEDQAARLGERLEKAKKVAPTRPHPHTPPRPGILKAVGMVTAAADRARDAISGRGRD